MLVDCKEKEQIVLAYAKKKKFIVRIRKQSVEPKGKTHPRIGKDWNQIHAPSEVPSVYHLCSFLCMFSLSFFACPLFISFSCWSNSITENEANWELPSLGNTSPAAREGQKVFFGLKSMAALFPSHQNELPGSQETLFCTAHLTGQSFFHVSQGRSTWKHSPWAACRSALTTDLQAASPQNAETSFRPTAYLQQGEKHISP